MSSYESIKRIAFENVEDCFHDGVKLAELRFAPTFMAANKSLGHDEIIEGVLDGVKEGMERFDIQVGLIGILPRSFDFAENIKSLDALIHYRKHHPFARSRLVGFDLADMERARPFSDFSPLIEQARKAGFGITIHSGEDTDHQCILSAIATYDPKRIGHGIRAIDDPKTVDLIKERDIHLEICPISNWLTCSVADLSEHPLPRLFKLGVSVSLNSDDPHIMNISLLDEYENALEKGYFTMDQLLEINSNALRYSFLDDDVKKHIEGTFRRG
jgi:adenosine deaminase